VDGNRPVGAKDRNVSPEANFAIRGKGCGGVVPRHLPPRPDTSAVKASKDTCRPEKAQERIACHEQEMKRQ
jgi:hypothetical protein